MSRPPQREARAVALIDGEHYPPVVREALESVSYEVVAAVLVGGTEKLRGDADYGVPLAAGIDEAIADYAPEIVLDLSDEPVLGPVERMELASRVLVQGLAYEGADFRFEPPEFADFVLPSLAVIGTGKRVGKTAVTGHIARLLSRDRHVVVVAMGRGGPPEPEVIRAAPTVDELVALSRSGRHAASDHLETAALAGVETVGCRRCGGGLAGAVTISNVLAGAEVAVGLAPDLVVFDGSGAALPPIAARRRVVVVGAHQDVGVATGYLNGYRHRLADLVILTMAEEDSGHAELAGAIRRLVRPGVAVISTVLRPRPMVSVTGREVAFFGTAPPSAHPRIASHLRHAYGAEVVHVSGNLADRAALYAELPHVHAECFVVELKAAAVDVVAEDGVARGIDVVLAANDVVALPGEQDLDYELRRLAEEAGTADEREALAGGRSG